MANANAIIYRTGDYNSLEDARSCGATRTIYVQEGQCRSTIERTIFQTSNLWGYSADEIEITWEKE